MSVDAMPEKEAIREMIHSTNIAVVKMTGQMKNMATKFEGAETAMRQLSDDVDRNSVVLLGNGAGGMLERVGRLEDAVKALGVDSGTPTHERELTTRQRIQSTADIVTRWTALAIVLIEGLIILL